MGNSRFHTEAILDMMGKVFDEAQGGLRDELTPAEYEVRRRDFVFHMTDWASDLERMARLFEDPGTFSQDEATTFIIGFLYHVIPHLNAAGQLLLDEVPDPFATRLQSKD